MNPPFSAVLLAGGKSSRMGRDKALLEIEGAPLWQRQLRILRELSPNECFIAGALPNAEDAVGWQKIPDAINDTGPLGGLTAALRRCSTPLLLALAVDLPNMTAAYLTALLTDCLEDRGVVPRLGDRFEPLAAIYPASVLPLAEGCLATGTYSLQKFVRACLAGEFVRPRDVSSSDERFFFNMNTPEDFAVVA
ncbi:MAG: molybdenum cofactor guanylyltransferase [Chthoniobacterales bacterium]